MKKNELIDKVADATGLKKTVVRSVLESTNDVVRDAIHAGDEVFLFGLGKLDIVRRGPKAARNIRTGEPVRVPARNVVTFRPSESLADAVNSKDAE